MTPLNRLTFVPADGQPQASHLVAGSIAEMSLRECAFLDELWIRRNPTRVMAAIKRRHKQFLAELLAFYCCITEQFLEIHEEQVAWFVNSVAEEVAEKATRDGFIMMPPYFQSDQTHRRKARYHGYIVEKLSRARALAPCLSSEALVARAALDIRTLMDGAQSNLVEIGALESQVARRLDWTARELTGMPKYNSPDR
jgi:hypothetical protein